ncbi:hypothetical protein WR25_06340 [Diploscapter pachys]|uniref:DUF38 domain-containing protein n=1 Tax=Diploscapter pachys TaxID=2018661 RepID=A0A2A2L9U1_9BILA|nr:hypothetical protein WR25_06340 [Diploscapter pachys]
MNVSNWYHDVFRKTPFVNFHCLENLPYTYEDLFGIFKDTKRLRLTNSHMITDEQVCKIVQDFYEGKHDEDYIFEIGVGGENVKVEDYLKLIPKEAYRLKVIRKRSFDSSYEMKTWAKMTDRFGRKWALVDMTIHDEMDEGNLRIYNMKYSGVRHCGWGFCS